MYRRLYLSRHKNNLYLSWYKIRLYLCYYKRDKNHNDKVFVIIVKELKS